MISDTTEPARPAIPDRYRAVAMMGGRTIEPDLIVFLEVDHSRRGNDGQPEMWNAEFGGERIVFRDRDPEHAACRVLLAQGIAGLVLFVQKATGTPGASMDVTVGAGLTTSENDTGLRRRKYVPFSRQENAPATDRPSPGIDLPADQIASAEVSS